MGIQERVVHIQLGLGEVEGMGNREGKEDSWSSCYSLVLLGKTPRPRLQGGGEKILRSREIPGEPDHPRAKLSYCLQRPRNSLSRSPRILAGCGRQI